MVTTADVYFGFSMVFAKNIFRLIGCSSCIQKKDILKYQFCYVKTYGGSKRYGLCIKQYHKTCSLEVEKKIYKFITNTKSSTFKLLTKIKIMQYFCKPRTNLYCEQILFNTKGYFWYPRP